MRAFWKTWECFVRECSRYVTSIFRVVPFSNCCFWAMFGLNATWLTISSDKCFYILTQMHDINKNLDVLVSESNHTAFRDDQKSRCHLKVLFHCSVVWIRHFLCLLLNSSLLTVYHFSPSVRLFLQVLNVGIWAGFFLIVKHSFFTQRTYLATYSWRLEHDSVTILMASVCIQTMNCFQLISVRAQKITSVRVFAL